MTSYVSRFEFNPQPPDTIVVTCSDGRTRRHVADFLDELGLEADVYAIPGGPLALISGVEVFQDSSVAQKRLKFLAEEHKTRRVILITHGGEDASVQCSMAVKLYPRASPSERLGRQKAALLEAARRLSSVMPIPVECYLANVIRGQVRFEKVE